MEFSGAVDNDWNYSFDGEVTYTIQIDGDTGATSVPPVSRCKIAVSLPGMEIAGKWMAPLYCWWMKTMTA